jgi:murein DD-endopeptidase MepM/ murein hydrolase activator NlpD
MQRVLGRVVLAYIALPLLFSIPLLLVVTLTSSSAGPCVQVGTDPQGVSDARIPAEYAVLVNNAATAHAISAPWLAGLLQTESGWNPRAVSEAGALGLGQLMPETARQLGVTDPFDPAQNIDGSARYLAEQYRSFGSYELAAAAYNAGPGAVRRYGGIPPYAQTQAYVPRVKALAQQFGSAPDDAVLVCVSSPIAAGPVIAGGVACPVGQPHDFSDTWGAPRSGGRTHKGVDIFADTGIPLYAYTSGTIRLTSSPLGGVSLWVDGDTGDEYYYAHLSAYADGMATGVRVNTGDLVGYVGQTGNARYTPPHLHWEVHPGGGAAVNPTPYARAACG